MIQSTLRWNGEQAVKLVLAAGWQGIKRATVFFWDTLTKKVLVVPNTGKRVRRKRTTRAGVKGSSYTIYPDPSEPGEPPRLRTGQLRKNVIKELDREHLKSRVGVTKNAIYGAYLELGTRRVRARPWLFETLKQITPQLKAIAEGRTP